MRLYRLAEQRPAGERGECGRTNNDKRQTAFHEKRDERQKLQRTIEFVKFSSKCQVVPGLPAEVAVATSGVGGANHVNEFRGCRIVATVLHARPSR